MLPETSYEPLIAFLEDRAVEEDDYNYSVMGTLEGRISCLHQRATPRATTSCFCAELLVESTSQAGEALLPYNREELARSLMATFLSRGRVGLGRWLWIHVYACIYACMHACMHV
jgi:hypothetical protein